MTDFYKMSSMMKDLFPSNPEADKQALRQMANAPAQEVAPTKDYVNESAKVPQGSMPLDLDLDSFAKLAGVAHEAKQKTGSDGQAKGNDPMPKTSTPSTDGEQPHPLKDKLVGEEDDEFSKGSISAAISGIDDIVDAEENPSMLVARGLKKAVEGEALGRPEREALAPYAELFAKLILNPKTRAQLISMNVTLNKAQSPQASKETESIKERLYRELKNRKA